MEDDLEDDGRRHGRQCKITGLLISAKLLSWTDQSVDRSVDQSISRSVAQLDCFLKSPVGTGD